MFQKGYKFSVSGALLIILCFFLPNVLVSCGSVRIAEISGWQLAAGTDIGSGNSAQHLDGETLLFLIPVGAILILGLAYLASKRGAISKGLDGIGVIIFSVIPVFIAWIKLNDMHQQTMSQGLQVVQVDPQYGFWGIVIGFALAIIGGVMNFRE